MTLNPLKKFLAVSLTSLVLVGCGVQTEQPIDEAEKDDQVTEPVEVSNVTVNVTSEITEVVDKVNNGVVSIINLRKNDYQSWASMYESQQDEDEYLQAGSGSGAVYKIEGDRAYVFTNNHVVEGSDAIDVLLQDGTRVPAEVEGADLWTDLAVLSIDAQYVDTVLEFGDSDNIKVGEPAIAIGSPLGTEFASSVTSGIISGLGRTVPVDTNGDGQPDWEMTAIQTDAAINPGNSGGPLVNIAGQVVGINSMKISSSTIEGMGFAIPSNDAVNIINQLEQNGEVIRPYLGISMVDLSLISSAQRTEELNLPADVKTGILISRVENASPAAEAGIQPGDVLVSFDGEAVDNTVQLRQMLYLSEIDTTVSIELYRNGEPRVINLPLEAAE